MNAAEDGTFEFEWVPTDDYMEVAYIAEVTAGADSECTVVREAEGAFGHESGVGHFLAQVWPENISISSSRWMEMAAAHAGQVNTFQKTHSAWTTFAGDGGWYSRGGGAPFQNETRIYLNAAFDLEEDNPEPLFYVACEGPSASLRFYRALDVVPISPPAAKGGAGFHTWLPPSPADPSLNHGDRYSYKTEAKLNAFIVTESPARPGWPADPVVEGRLDLKTPHGDEVISLQPGPWSATRVWHGPGTYELTLDRAALGVWPLVGIMGGFELEEELGSSDSLSASRLDRMDSWAPANP